MIDGSSAGSRPAAGEDPRSRPSAPGLRLRLLGGFSAWVDGRPVDAGAWRRRKVSRLVKLLALAPDHRLHREQVECLLWPSLEARAAAQNLHHTLYRARHTLEPGLPRRGEPRFMRLRNDLLELAPCGELESDLDRFERAAAAALAAGDAELFGEAVGLFGGELLPEERFEDWAIDRRDSVKATYVELLLELAAIERRRARLDAAIDALKRIVAVEPLHEDAQAHLIYVHGLAGRRHLAVAHYHRFRDLLKSELEAEPLPATMEIYRSVVSGRICPTDAIATDLAAAAARFERERAAPALQARR
jgi:DNA-binding SARP family transcriptional activator